MAESHREEIAKLEALYAGNPGGRVFVHLAEAYRKAGEHERARRILDEGLARHTDSASGYVVLGRVLADMQITDEAEVAFRRVLELDGGNLVALRWLGDLARQSGRNAEAAGHYRELLVRNPSNEEVRDLVEIVERSDPAARPAAPEDTSDVADASAEAGLTDWAAPSAGQPDEEQRDEPAVAEPIRSFEESAVTPPPVEEPEPADVTPWSAAPGQAGDVSPPAIEYGVVDIDVLPGDAAQDIVEDHVSEPETPAFLVQPESDRMDEPVPADADSDLVASWNSDDGAVLELDELSRDDEAEPMEIHLLDPAWEPQDDETEDLAAELDIADLSSLGAEEVEGEYADDAFLADLASVPQDEMGGDDFAPVDGDPFTLMPAQPDAAAAEPAEVISEPPEEIAAAQPYDVAADEPYDVAAEEPYDVAADVPYDVAADEADATTVEEPLDATAESYGAPAADAGSVAEPGLMTETMAVLYRTQGFHDRAADVYRALLRQRPDDARLAARLKEAEEAAAVSRTKLEPEEETGEVWLRGVGAVWSGGGTAEPEAATPYTWTAAAEEVESGEPITSYLRELVAWKGGQTRWSEGSPAPTSPPVRGDDTDASPPDWLVAADDDAATPWVDAAVEEVASWSPAQTPPEDAAPWAPIEEPELPASETSLPQTGGDELPADPWLQGEPQPEQFAPEPPAATPEAPVVEAAVPDAGAGWTPFELDRDEPPATTPAATAPAEVPPPAVSLSAEDDPAEDEDLEMFRSWLQSLKK